MSDPRKKVCQLSVKAHVTALPKFKLTTKATNGVLPMIQIDRCFNISAYFKASSDACSVGIS